MNSQLSSKNLEELLKFQFANPLGFPNSEIVLNTDWSSKSNTHRFSIRTNLRDRVRALQVSESSLETILDLSAFPRLDGHAVSISHCPDLGGFVLIPNTKAKIGFDVELASRINLQIAERVLPHLSETHILSKLRAANGPPFPSFAWAAKESAIKCFGNAFAHESLNFTNVSLTHLEAATDSIYSFSSNFDGESARGLVGQLGHRVFAISVLP